ncbi:protein of unknown function [Cyanobium sp. NIES-981]|nr:protein of unknown function [Cyanobium sp. NIES-981]
MVTDPVFSTPHLVHWDGPTVNSVRNYS